MRPMEMYDVMERKELILANDNLLRLLQTFGHSNDDDFINTEEFVTVMEKHSNSTFNDGISEKHKHGEDDVIKARAKEITEELRQKMKKNTYKCFVSLFNHFDDSRNNTLDIKEFTNFINSFITGANKKETALVFNMIDVNSSGYVTKEEFVEFFGMTTALNDPELKSSVKKTNEGKFDNICKDINASLNALEKSGEAIFGFTKLTVKKQDFVLQLKSIRIVEKDFANFNEFLVFLRHKSNESVIDLDKFKFMLENYFIRNKKEASVGIGSTAEIFIFELLVRFNNDITKILEFYDNDKNGFISNDEFMIDSIRLFPTNSKAETLEVYHNLSEGNNKIMSVSKFKEKLQEVYTKYNNSAVPNPVPEMTPRSGSIVIPNLFISNNSSQSQFKKETETGTNASIKPVDPNDKLTPEEREIRNIAELYARVRKALDYKEDDFIAKLKEHDTTGSLKLHQNYIFKILSGYGINLVEYEKKMLLTGIDNLNEQIFYFDLVHKIFPQKQIGVTITNLEDFVAFLLKDMNVSRKPLSALYEEFKGGSKDDFISLEKFKNWFMRRGIVLSEEKIMDLYGEIDVSKDFKVQLEEFNAAITKGSKIDPVRTIIEKIKGAMQATNKTTDTLFTKYKDITSFINFVNFTKAMGDLQLDLNIFEMENTYKQLDVGKTGLLKIEELKKIFDAPPEIESLTKDTLRKIMYRTIKNPENNLKGLNDLFNFYSMNQEFLKKNEFVNMITKGCKWTTAKPDEINNLFKEIDDDQNFFVSRKELADFYNESKVSELFPFILAFKVKLREKVLTDKVGLSYFYKECDEDGDEFLDLKEFRGMLRKLGMGTLSLDEQTLIFREIDCEGFGKVTCTELRTAANSHKTIDVVELSSSIKGKIRKDHIKIEDLFLKSKGTREEMSFIQFFDLVNKDLNLGVNILEAEELFVFIDANNNSNIDKTEFLRVFEGYSSINPYTLNPGFMEKLTSHGKKFYEDKYKFNQTDVDQRQIDDKFFNQFKKESAIGTNSSVVGPQGQIGILDTKYGASDIKFVSRLRRYMKDQKTELMDLYQYIQNSDREVDTMSIEELKRMDQFIKSKLTPDEVNTVFQNMEPKDGVVKVFEFKRYVDSVGILLGDSKAEARMMIPTIRNALLKKVSLENKEPKSIYFGKTSKKQFLMKKEFVEFLKDLPFDEKIEDEDGERFFNLCDTLQKGLVDYEMFKKTIVNEEFDLKVNGILEQNIRNYVKVNSVYQDPSQENG